MNVDNHVNAIGSYRSKYNGAKDTSDVACVIECIRHCKNTRSQCTFQQMNEGLGISMAIK